MSCASVPCVPFRGIAWDGQCQHARFGAAQGEDGADGVGVATGAQRVRFRTSCSVTALDERVPTRRERRSIFSNEFVRSPSRPRLPGNMTLLRALDLSTLGSEQVRASVAAAPHYTSHLGRSIELVIQAIHGIPGLEDASREEVEVYLGRSCPDGLHGRFRSHRDEREHTGGVCLFKLPTALVPLVEKAGIRILTLLKERKKLCIANAAADSRGPLPSDETSVIYLTWRIVRARRVDKAGIQDVREVAREVCEAVDGRISRGTLERGIECIKRPSDAAPMSWL
jgi:hypothetical protein